jgi:hypothetical protein
MRRRPTRWSAGRTALDGKGRTPDDAFDAAKIHDEERASAREVEKPKTPSREGRGGEEGRTESHGHADLKRSARSRPTSSESTMLRELTVSRRRRPVDMDRAFNKFRNGILVNFIRRRSARRSS